VNRPKVRKVAACQIKNAIRMSHQLPRDRVTDPQAAQLISGESLCPCGQHLQVSATNPTMLSDSAERQVSAVAQIHHMLPRSAQHLRGFTGRDQRIGGAVRKVMGGRRHVQHDMC
jgi:hypothetical protein